VKKEQKDKKTSDIVLKTFLSLSYQ